MNNLGARLRDVRIKSGLSVRALARQVNVSPSFVSQIENGKSQPSVATLYAFAQLLNVSVDELFDERIEARDLGIVNGHSGSLNGARLPTAQPPDNPMHNPSAVWQPSEYANRVSVVHPTHRSRIDMAAGVIWERLAATPEHGVNFMEIVYTPGASSTDTGGRSQHLGYEYGFVLAGILEVTIGEEIFNLHSGDSLGFDSEIPHTFHNPGAEVMRGVWFVHGASH